MIVQRVKQDAGLILVALALATASPVIAAPVPHTYGPEPGWPAFRAMAEAEVRARLIDPDSAKFYWTAGYHKGGFKPLLAPRIGGYVACGLVNARNRMGGYTGARFFLVVIDYGRPLYAEIASGVSGIIPDNCVEGRAKGLFPPLAATNAIDERAALKGIGIALQPMPEGGYVTAVEPGGAAARAGLKPGMVVTALNGIQLAGLGDSMTRIVGQVAGDIKLTLVGGENLTLHVPADRPVQ